MLMVSTILIIRYYSCYGQTKIRQNVDNIFDKMRLVQCGLKYNDNNLILNVKNFKNNLTTKMYLIKYISTSVRKNALTYNVYDKYTFFGRYDNFDTKM